MELHRIKNARPLTNIEVEAIAFLGAAKIKPTPNVVYDIFACGCVCVAGHGITVPHGKHKWVSCPKCRQPILTKYKKCACDVDWIGRNVKPSKSNACTSCYHKTRRTNAPPFGKSKTSIPHKATAARIIKTAPRVTIYPPKKKNIKCVHTRICGDSCFFEGEGDCSMFQRKGHTSLWA